MSSALAAEVASDGRSPTPLDKLRGNRRKARWITAAIALSAVIAGAGAWWLSSYQPLAAGTRSGAGRLTPEGVYPDETLNNVYGTEYVIESPDEGDKVGLITSVVNDGPLAVSLTGVDLGFTWRELVLTDVEATIEPLARTYAVDADHPLVIKPGDAVDLTLKAAIPTCPGQWMRNGGGTTSSTVTLHYTALGISHTGQLDLGYSLTINEGVFCD